MKNLLCWPLMRNAEPDPDDRLVTRARQGETEAFDTLRQRHDRALRGYVARRVGPGAADDVLQDVWIACWGALARFSGRSRFKAWVYGIASHKCTDYLRTRGQSARSEEAAEKTTPSQTDAYAAVDLRQAVLQALGSLPDSQREVVELYYYGELTLAEIATQLDRNQNTVKYQFYRAHEHVARELQREGSQQE